jgi:hypothetical protein
MTMTANRLIRFCGALTGFLLFLFIPGAVFGASAAAPADDQGAARFALIIGVNRSIEPGVSPLRYADDDAARYRDLLEVIGARTYLLATLDQNTRRVHPEAAAEARPAELAELRATVKRLAKDVAEARREHRTALYVIYAGHGHVDRTDGRTGYVSLDDGRLTGQDFLREIIDPVAADQNHLLVDACSSYLLVTGRGGAGERWPVAGYARIGGALLERKDIGLLLSTSSARESHEWSAFQAGVFSHEVRSGMYGPADVDGDGIVSYREMAAFIRRANESIPNEKFRPELFWQPPRDTTALIDLRRALARRVEIPGTDGAHYFLEDPRGVRLADFHNGRSLTVRLVRPPVAQRLYLQRTKDQREYVLSAAAGAVLNTSELRAEEPRVSVRSAAHEAFAVLFDLPFDTAALTGVVPPPLETLVTADPAPPPSSPRRPLTIAFGSISAAAVAVGAGALLTARSLHDQIRPDTTQREASTLNERISTRNQIARVAFVVGGAAALAAALTALWPSADAPPVAASASADQLTLQWQGRF